MNRHQELLDPRQLPTGAPPGSAGTTVAGPVPGADAPRVSGPRQSSKSWTVVEQASVVGAAVVAADQVTKAAGTSLGNTALTHPVTNPEFSLGLAGGSLPLMVVVTVLGTVAFGAYVVWQTLRGRLAAWVPGLLLGGAVSNFADRLVVGAVRDFITSPWVVWNLADLAVVVGIGGYAWGHLRRRTDRLIDVRGGELSS
ncbi:MAG TPA: signal peptidase II [Acidimicrobiales bacterium]|nr:signal peptidase II [Acidimicrobiales bacterium]